MKNKKALLLKENWDLSWSNSLPKNGDDFIFPIFSGINLELNRLTGIISKGTGGVVFVGGANGAGKTAFAYKAIYSAKKDNKKIVCIPINNLILDPKDQEKKANQLVYETLKQMIRSAAKSDELKKKSSFPKLMRLKNLVSLTTYIRKLSDSDSREINSEVNFETNLSQTLKFIAAVVVIALSPVFSGLITLIVNFLNDILATAHITLENIITQSATILGLAIPFTKVVDLGYSKIDKHLFKKQKTYEINGISIHELEQEFNEVVDELEDESTEIVFLFEELDYFDRTPEFDEGKLLLNIFKSLKSLFHNSHALFILLVGEKNYQNLLTDPYRTIPTETFLIPKATPTVFLDYLHACLGLDANDQQFDQDFALLIYRSKGNFYNLKKIMRESRKFESDKKEYLLLPELSDDKIFQASILLASFQFIEPYESEERDIIFEALMFVVKDFEESLMLNPVNHIVIPDSVKKNENATKVMIAFTQHLFTIGKTFKSNLAIPKPNDARNPLNIGDVIWQNLRDSLPNSDYSYLYKKQVGVILPEEKEFMEKYDLLREVIDNINGIKGLNFDQAMEKLQTTYGYPSNASINELIENTRNALGLIKNKTLKDRGEGWFEKLSQQFIPQIQRLIESLDKHIKLNGNAIVAVGEAEADNKQGSINVILANRAHQGGQEFASLIKLNQPIPKSFYKKFNLEIKKEGIVNILLGMNNWTSNTIDQEFLMVRFDNRINGINGIFKKSSGSKGWNTSEHVLEKNKDQFKKQYMTLRVVKNNKLSVNYPNGKLSIEIDKIKWIGIANELAEATINFSHFKETFR